jgi:hypothetical protein
MGKFRGFVAKAADWLGYGHAPADDETPAKQPGWLASVDWVKACFGASALMTLIRWLDGQLYSFTGFSNPWLWHYLSVTATAGCIHLLLQLDKLELPQKLKAWFVPTAIGLGALLIYKESLNIVIYFLFPNPV